MLNNKELKELGIHNWVELRKQFEGSNLLLGNGFSLNIASSFHYESLFEKFLEKCPPEYADKFVKFKTHNFERILEKLINTKEVNLIFGSDSSQIEEAMEILKVGLITTIQDIHPRAEEIYWGTLEKIATQLRFFKNIFTLNYDLFLYHIVMIMKDQCDKDHNLSRYSDCFWQEHDQDFNRFNSYQDYSRFRFVYYLHGALFLFRESLNDLKLLRKPGDQTELVERVGKVIEGGRMPLFVCEGASAEKQETIGTSNYLNFALRRKLEFSKENLVIFGTSLSRQDQHIIDAIDCLHKTNHRTKDLAISVHISTKSKETLERETDETRNKFRNCNIYFFDSETLFDFLSIRLADSDKIKTTKRMNLDLIRKHWPEIIESMRGEGEHGNLDAFLRSTCEPIEFRDNTLTMGFYYRFHLEYMQNRDYQELLERKISQILETPVKLQYIISKRRNTA